MKYERTDEEWIDEDLHVKIFRNGQSPRWYCQFNVPGRGQQRVSLKTTSLKEARSRARRIVRDLESGNLSLKSNASAIIATVAERHLAYLETRGKDAKTIELYHRCYSQLQQWGRSRGIVTISQLNVAALEQFEDTLRQHGVMLPSPDGKASRRRRAKPNKPKTIRNKLVAVRCLIKWAKHRGLIEHDPSASYDLPPGKSAEIEIFSPEELGVILADPDPTLANIWAFYSLTGLRAEELCWLTTDDAVQSERGWEVLIRAKKCSQTGRQWHPKHRMERTVPLTAPAAIEIVRRAIEKSPGPWLFRAKDTTSAQRGRWMGVRLLKWLKKRLDVTGIDHGTLHTFRHTLATFLANNPNVSLVHVQKVLGHRSIETTMRYVHASSADVAQSLARVDFGQMVAPGGGQKRQVSQVPVDGEMGGPKPAA